MTTTGTTTIRVTVRTRDLILRMIKNEMPGKTADEAVQFLYDEHWKAQCIADAERWRREHPDEYRAELAELERWTASDIDLDAIEGPYFRSKEELDEALNWPAPDQRNAA